MSDQIPDLGEPCPSTSISVSVLDSSWEDIDSVCQRSLLDDEDEQSQSSLEGTTTSMSMTTSTTMPTTPTAGAITSPSSSTPFTESDVIIVPAASTNASSATSSPASTSATSSPTKYSEIISPPRHSVAHRRFLPTLFPIFSSEDCPWEELEDDLAITLENNPDSLQLFHSVHSAGVCERPVLQSLAYLSSSTSSPSSMIKSNSNTNSSSNGNSNERQSHGHTYTDAVSTVAHYLAQHCHQTANTADQTVKLACLRLLMTLRSPIEAGWQLEESVLSNTVLFVTDRSYDWEYLDHSDQVLLWELRAICLNEQERILSEQLGRIQRRGKFTAASISAGARFVEAGLLHSTNMVTSGIGETGGLLTSVLEPNIYNIESTAPLSKDHDLGPATDADMNANTNTHTTSSGMHMNINTNTLVVTGAAKRVTDDARVTTKGLVMELRRASSQALHTAAIKFQEGNMGEKLVPHAEHRVVLTAVGEVGMASLGAAAIVGEAVYNSTSAVVKKTADITVDVVQHKFGHSAGQVVRDTSDTAGNVLRTIATVAAFKGRVLTNSIAKDVGKNHVQKEYEKGSSLLDKSMDCDEQEEEQADKSDAEESEVSVGAIDIRTIYLSESGVDSKDADDGKHGDNVAAGHETDETESVTLCGDEADSRIPETCTPLKLEAQSPYEGGGLQIHTRDQLTRTVHYHARLSP